MVTLATHRSGDRALAKHAKLPKSNSVIQSGTTILRNRKSRCCLQGKLAVRTRRVLEVEARSDGGAHAFITSNRSKPGCLGVEVAKRN